MGTLIFSYIRRLGPFLGLKILNFYILFGFQKNYITFKGHRRSQAAQLRVYNNLNLKYTDQIPSSYQKQISIVSLADFYANFETIN